MLFKTLLGSASLLATNYVVRAADRATVPPSCLSKLESFGTSPVSGATTFDQTSALSAMPASFTPYGFNLCLDSNRLLVSLQLTFADEDGTETFTGPRLGKEDSGTCRDFEFGERSGFQKGRIDLIENNGRTRVISMSLDPREEGGNPSVFGDNSPSMENAVFTFTDDQEIVGFHGTMTGNIIAELGFVVVSKSCVEDNSNTDGSEGSGEEENDSCTANSVSFSSKTGSSKCEDKRTVSFSSKDLQSSDDDDEEAVDIWIIWVVVIVSIVLTILIVIIVHFATKKNGKRSGKVGAVGEQSQPHTANNSQLPVDSEVVDLEDDVKRASRKDTERQPMHDTNAEL